MGRFAIFARKIKLGRVCNFGPQKLHYEGFAVLVHKKLYEGLQFLPKKLHLGDNISCWVFVDVGLEVSNHIKFSVCFYLFFLLLFMGVLSLEEIIFSARDFPTVVSELRFWPRFSNQGRKRSSLAYQPESTSFEESGVHDAPRSSEEVANGALKISNGDLHGYRDALSTMLRRCVVGLDQGGAMMDSPWISVNC